MILTICLIITTYQFLSSFKNQRFVENYPLPRVYVVSSQENQGDDMDYLFELEAENYTNIRVNNRLLEVSDDGKLQTIIQLDKPKTTIKIEARNQYKATKKEIMITRNETEIETTQRLAREEEERIQKEEAEKGSRREALVCAEMKVESLLKNPAGAKFESWFSSNDVVVLGNNEYMV